MGEDFFEEHLRGVPIVAIFRGESPERTVQLCEDAWDAGILLVEVPIQDESAMWSLRAAIDVGRARGRLVGAGTVTTTRRLDAVVALGAAFTVSPGVAVEVMVRSSEIGLPHLPGVATASDIMLAERYDNRWMKAFPAASLPPQWVEHMRGPFPEAFFVATGGVRVADIDEFLGRGFAAVGIGAELAGRESIESIRGHKSSRSP